VCHVPVASRLRSDSEGTAPVPITDAIAVLEKFVYTVRVVSLYLNSRIQGSIMRASPADPIFAVLFVIIIIDYM